MSLKNATNTGIVKQTTQSTLTRAGTQNALLLTRRGGYPSADFTLSAASGVQTLFPTACDVYTLEASTLYRFRGFYKLATGTTTHTTAMAFAAAGGLTFQTDGFQYFVMMTMVAANATGTAQTTIQVNTNASTVLNATSTAATTNIWFEGLIRTNVGGTLTPQINFSANPGGTNLLKIGSYIEFEAIGAHTVQAVGGGVS